MWKAEEWKYHKWPNPFAIRKHPRLPAQTELWVYHKPSRLARFWERRKWAVISITLLVFLLLVIPASSFAWALVNGRYARDITTVYRFDPDREFWVKTVYEVELPNHPDGTRPRGSNTLIIRLDENNPVKQIIVNEALVIKDSSSSNTSPLFEISGHDSESAGATGKLHIGKLLIRKVDAERLDIDDTKVVRLDINNVVAKDNEFRVDVDVVNVVRTGRGGASSLFIGTSRKEIAETALSLMKLPDDLDEFLSETQENGLRVDRIRILGPNSGQGFIEKLVVFRTSVFGEFRVRDVEVQDLVLRDISLDDSNP